MRWVFEAVQARLARPAPAASRIWRGPPGHEYSGKTQQYQRERNRAPPVLPEGSKTMVGLTPNPEDAEKQENGADNLANPTHSLKTIPADVLARVAADTGGRQGGLPLWRAATARPRPPRTGRSRSANWPEIGRTVLHNVEKYCKPIRTVLAGHRERPGRRGSARARPASMASVGQTLGPAVMRWKLGAG